MIYGDWLEALQEFNELAGDNWKIVLNRMLRGKADISELDRNIQAAFRVFVCSVKKMILEDRKKDLAEVEEILHNQILYHLLEKYERTLSNVSCDLEKLCILYLLGEESTADKLVEGIFDSVIVRKNDDFLKTYKEYGLESEEVIKNIADVLDSLVMAAVRTRSSSESFRKFLNKNIPDDFKLTNKVIILYEKNFSELRNRYLIEMEEKNKKSENSAQ